MASRIKTDLSIIVPVYKGKEYLSSLISSVCALKNQADDSKIELLLIDDGSPDGSASECQRIADMYRFVSAYEKENGGIADTRNFGLRHARGEYVCFMDQDDAIVPKVCIKAMKKIKEEQADGCLWSSNHRFEDGTQRENVRILEERVYDKKEIRQALLDQYLQKDEKEKLFHIPGYVWSGIYSKKFLEENQICFFSFVDYEDDCIFMNQVMRHAEKIVQIPDVGYLWTCNLKSESHRSRYIENYWEKNQKLEQWFQCEIYDIFDGYKPSEIKVKQGKAIKIYNYVENECGIKNKASAGEIVRRLKGFFDNSEYYQCIKNEEKPYGGTGMRRRIMHGLIRWRQYGMLFLFLRIYGWTVQRVKIKE